MIRDHGLDRMANVEQSFIAAMLLDPDVLGDLAGRLCPSHFANREPGLIYDAARGLHSRDVAVSPTAVVEELRRRGQLTPELELDVHELWGSSGSAANARWCADQIIAAWQARELDKACVEARKALHEPDPDRVAIQDRLEAQIEKIGKFSQSIGPRSICEDLLQVTVEAEKAERLGGRPRGVPTGFANLDHTISGLQNSQLVVLAAQTSKGKSALAMNIAANVARRSDGVVVVFSLEMGRQEIAARISASDCGIDLQRIQNGRLGPGEWVRLVDAQSHLRAIGENILLDVSGRITPMAIRTHLRSIVRKRKIALVIVDYLQLCAPSERAESQYVRTSQISGDLKAIAVDLDVPVLALSQLSRDAARRGGEPRLSDLRDSGSIEQDANVVLFIHRESGDMDGGDAAWIIVAKNRNGPTGKFAINWDPLTVRFTDRPRSHVAPGGRS